MSIAHKLPDIRPTGDAVISIGVSRFISNHISQHEYALIFTFSRLIRFSIDRYLEAKKMQKIYLEDNKTLNMTSLVAFGSNIECFIDTLNRSALILGKLLEDYPIYYQILPDDVLSVQQNVYSLTREIRNKIQHLDTTVIGMKTKKIGSVIPYLNDTNEFELDKKKISISKLLNWLDYFDKYADSIAKYNIKVTNESNKKN